MNASHIAKILGRKGGRARARRLSAPERARIASQGGIARAESLRAARRILDNLRYVEAVLQLRPSTPVARVHICPGPLPHATAGPQGNG
jgi:hypothetical protein